MYIRCLTVQGMIMTNYKFVELEPCRPLVNRGSHSESHSEAFTKSCPDLDLIRKHCHSGPMCASHCLSSAILTLINHVPSHFASFQNQQSVLFSR